jgi:hypothetical protein
MGLQIGDLVRYRKHPDQIIGLVTRRGTNGWVKVAWAGLAYLDKFPQRFDGYTSYHSTELEFLSKSLNKPTPSPVQGTERQTTRIE